MIYLTGVTSDADEPVLISAGVGLMIQPGNSYHRRVDRYPYWAADNGCFNAQWVEEKHLMWLDALPRDRCLFAVAPDVYPSATATLARSEQYFDIIRDMGFPVALVAQDGAERLVLPWADFDCLFIGGERTANPKHEWKTSEDAEWLVRKARRAGKWVHMGRVNSLERLLRAKEMGCHSADGTYLKYTKRARVRDTNGPENTTGRGAHEIAQWHFDTDKIAAPILESPELGVYQMALRTRGAVRV